MTKKGIAFHRSNGSVGHFEGSMDDLIASEEHEPQPKDGLYPNGLEMKNDMEETPAGTRHIAADDKNAGKEGYYPPELKMEEK
jgi:hypothetical protein